MATFDESALDRQLVEAARGGDSLAFRELVDRHAAFICALAHSLSGSQRESDEIAHEAFVIAWRNLPRLQKPGSFRAWLWGITRNVTKKFEEKRAGRRPESRIDADNARAATVQPSPLDNLIAREEHAAVERALRRIPEIYRVPLLLHYWEQWSIKEVADALNLREDNVKQRLARGRRLMQGRLAPPPGHTPRGKRSQKQLVAAVTASLFAAGAADARAGTRSRVASVPRATWIGISAALAIPTVAALMFWLMPSRAGRKTDTAASHAAGLTDGQLRLAAVTSSLGQAAAMQANGSLPAAAVAEESKVAPIWDFDFEDGELPPTLSHGHLGRCPPRPGNIHCVTAAIQLATPGYAGLHVGLEDKKGLFRMADGLVLDFDYFLTRSRKRGSVQLSNRTQGGQYYVEFPMEGPGAWHHKTVSLSKAWHHKTKEIFPPGDLIGQVTFSMNTWGAPDVTFYMDNIRLVEVPTADTPPRAE